ncbi:hypothetical protein MYP_9 [Sporocytophaga myxococcoides]|uniref:Outer membrane protein beta-barrel domain-containing protein n=1 Tax=Sporocytophaga myxococcoides TaxID=153721 RepID=A0A098L9J7_9BACT|nr:hypothetical protein [Sporocytophaga myxococcoides]GAL82783.1 hypothetical protein MYP_9 [Sporocytophaga myxococcoides]
MCIKLFLISIVFLFVSGLSFAQIDTTNLSTEDEVDTVIIKKADYVIRKEVYIDEPKEYTRFLTIYGAPVYYSSYYDVCEDCKDFLTNQKRAADPLLSYRIGLNLSFTKEKIYITPGVAFTSVRERFIAGDFSEQYNLVNHYNYLDVSLAAGYKVGDGKLNCVIQGYGVVSRLIEAEGKIISTKDFTSVNSIKTDNFKTYVFSLGLGFRLGYKLSERLQLIVEPGYRGNISTVIKSKTPYVQQRNFFSTEIGLSFAF